MGEVCNEQFTTFQGLLVHDGSWSSRLCT